jgi:hypothetical protein
MCARRIFIELTLTKNKGKIPAKAGTFLVFFPERAGEEHQHGHNLQTSHEH